MTTRLPLALTLKKISEYKSINKRVKELKEFGDREIVVQGILKVAFDPNIVLHLPSGDAPYNRNVNGGKIDAIYDEWKDLSIDMNQSSKKLFRESRFIGWLEMMTEDDAQLIIKMKDHIFPYPGIDREVVQKAFPGLI